MIDEWDKYIQQDSGDDWEKYAVTESPTSPQQQTDIAGSLLGSSIGLGVAAGVGYGAYKTGIPQKIGGGIGTVIGGVTGIPKALNTQKSAEFAQEVRREFIKAHGDKIKEFGADLDKWTLKYPQRTIDVSDLVQEVASNPDFSKDAIGILRKAPKLDNMFKDPNFARELSLRDAQNVINYLNSKGRNKNLDVQDLINSLRGKQLDAFPELETTKLNYQKFIEPYKGIKGQFKFNRILNAIKNKFGGAEGYEAVKTILPKSLLKKINRYRASAKMTELPGQIPIVGGAMRTIGGMFGAAPMVMDAFKYASDPKLYTAEQETGVPREIIIKTRDAWEKMQRGNKPTKSETELLISAGLIS